MHILSATMRSEFLATPQLVRVTLAKGAVGLEPTLLIKGSTLLLKYVAQGAPMRLTLFEVDDRTCYALTIVDDPDFPGILWSIIQDEQEQQALATIAAGASIQVFLFNELAVNVAWAEVPVGPLARLGEIASASKLGPVDYRTILPKVSAILDRQAATGSNEHELSVQLPNAAEWKPIRAHYVTTHATATLLDLFSHDEGGHQEQLAVWLTDNLHPRSVYHSAQVDLGGDRRELTDILLSHEFGSILIESKALALWNRSPLPSRSKLSRHVSRHISKATSQLRGAMRRVRDGSPIFSQTNSVIDVERSQPPHGIVVIPDLDLVTDKSAYGLKYIKGFMEDTGGFLHLVDVSELMRIVQAAEMISARSSEVTPIMSFDYYLVERAKHALEAGTLCIEVLLSFRDAETR